MQQHGGKYFARRLSMQHPIQFDMQNDGVMNKLNFDPLSLVCGVKGSKFIFFRTSSCCISN